MYSEHDEGHGLVKTTWTQVRQRVHKANPEFATLVDEVSPGDDMPLFLAYYPYGHLVGNEIGHLLPDMNGGYFQLNEQECHKEIFKHLGYGESTAPLQIILDKSFEFFYDDNSRKIVTSPINILEPGFIYPSSYFFNSTDRNYCSNYVYIVASGARSTFMLANISNRENINNLKANLNIDIEQPKTAYDHHDIFKKINDITSNDKKWVGCMLKFPCQFLDNIINNKNWCKVKSYLMQRALDRFSYNLNSLYHETIFSQVLIRNNLRLNPQNFDTLKHIIRVALGVDPGYQPIVNDEMMPTSIIQKAFVDFYGLTQFLPTIIGPKLYKFEKTKNPFIFLYNTYQMACMFQAQEIQQVH